MPPMPAAENPKDRYFVILEIEKCVNEPAQRASAIAFLRSVEERMVQSNRLEPEQPRKAMICLAQTSHFVVRWSAAMAATPKRWAPG
jgi:hypothetical protein